MSARTAADGLRLAVGTLTVVPTPPPRRVDRRVAAWAMALGPLAGLLLAVPGAALLWSLDGAGAAWFGRSVNPALAAALAVGMLAVLTRAIHLDGLADTADGLGCGRPAAQALEVMRRGDVGPFGVTALVMVLLVQVLALAALVQTGLGPGSLLLALVVSRLALPLLCLRGVRTAREDGLGATVVGSVAPWHAGLSVCLAAAVLGAALWALPTLLGTGADAAASAAGRAAAAAVLGLGAAGLLAWRALRRLGGLTGDVLGAAVEATFTTVLVVLAVVA